MASNAVRVSDQLVDVGLPRRGMPAARVRQQLRGTGRRRAAHACSIWSRCGTAGFVAGISLAGQTRRSRG